MRLLYRLPTIPSRQMAPENDRQWLEQYLVNQARLNRNRYYGPRPIGYY